MGRCISRTCDQIIDLKYIIDGRSPKLINHYAMLLLGSQEDTFLTQKTNYTDS